MIKSLISPAIRYAIRNIASFLRERLDRARLWNWKKHRLVTQGDNPYEIVYTGRSKSLVIAKSLLRADNSNVTRISNIDLYNRTVFVSEFPMPGSLRVPWSLRTVITLGKPIEEIRSGFGNELRKRIRKYQNKYHTQQALLDDDINRAEREMLQPFAGARHGADCIPVDPKYVSEMARYGRLQLMLQDKDEVACQLSCATYWSGKRYWSMMRCGYSAAVFSDPKRLREVNTMNHYLEIEWAATNNYDYLDMQTSLGSPDDSILQWKRRWNSLLELRGQHGFFSIRLPRTGASQFLWHAPLFAVESRTLTLHLGLPNGPSDDEITARYREMGFGGLSKIYLHCARAPGENLLSTLYGYYKHLHTPPTIVCITSR